MGGGGGEGERAKCVYRYLREYLPTLPQRYYVFPLPDGLTTTTNSPDKSSVKKKKRWRWCPNRLR
jgi:hypothetical protein